MNIKKIVVCLLIIVQTNISQANNKTRNTDENFVVVIGAFAIQHNAERFAKRAAQQSLSAKFEFNPNRNLYYVFTLTTPIKDVAMSEAKRLREETSYSDAWVYQGNIGAPESVDINPVNEQPISIAVTEEAPVEPEVKPEETEVPSESEAKKFYFKVFRASDSKTIDGEVDAIDVDRTRKIGSYKSNEPVYLESPKSNSGKVILIANILGYRKKQVDINYNDPIVDDITLDETNGVVVPIDLVRLQKGDIVVMYNVFFFKDASVMLPESKYELDNLLEMMNDNPKCKIRLHGHTNGNASGKIISMGESKNFFSLTGAKDGFGTAKALSEARASIIRDYLIDKGIDGSRVETKAWGGSRSLYDKESVKAKENVRVEVEILEE